MIDILDDCKIIILCTTIVLSPAVGENKKTSTKHMVLIVLA